MDISSCITSGNASPGFPAPSTLPNPDSPSKHTTAMQNPVRLKPHHAAFPQRLIGILGFLLSALMLPAATLHLDAVKGNDSSGDGSSGAPFRSFQRALAALQTGDTLLMYDGNYGDIFAGRTNHPAWQAEPVQHFSDWVTVEAAPGHHPTLNTLSLGTVNIPDSGSPRQKIPFSQKGNVDVWMVFDGLTVEDGISISGARNVEIRNCKVSSKGPLNGSTAIMDGLAAVKIHNGRYITISDCEITQTAIGINAASYDLTIRDNHIHHISHDGIRALGGEDWLIEGNRIHNLDDGLNDNAVDEDGNLIPWNRHADGIHVFTAADTIARLTIRGNVFFHIESMGIMAQNGKTDRVHSDWFIENNVFGPAGGLVFHFGTPVFGRNVFRHNTVVYAPNDVWTSIFGRRMQGTIYRMSIWNVKPELIDQTLFYNNCFVNANGFSSVAHFNFGLNAANPFFSETTGFPYEVPPGNIEDFINSGKRPGAPIAANALTDAGVTNHASELRKDILGYTRDGLPDIGAYEWNATSTPPLQLNPVGNRVITAGQPMTIQVSAEDAGSAVLEFSATGPD